MSKYNKSYRIRTEIGKNTQLHVKLDQKYDVLEIMSLKINQENAYRLHTSNYGVIAGRVLANNSFGIPNAKISVFINIDDNDINDPVKAALYPYNTTNSKDKDGVRYNLLPNEQVTDCHTIIGTFPEKQYALDNDSILEVFEKYYKYTTRTNEAGDYMIFGVPVGSQTVHVDIDLSDIGILSQKPRDMVYKGYNINQFENPNKFKYDTNLNSLTQVISQDSVTDVIPFWGDETEGMIGITRCDIDIQYKFEPTCVFMGSVVSDTASNGISKKCIPSPGMGAMDELTTGSGTIEMIRKKPDGGVEEFQIQGTQLINGDGVWCYQIPMNLDYMMTDEFGNIVPTNDPNKGIPTRTRVRFRISMQDFETDNANVFRCKMLVPHNPDIYSDTCEDELDYQFGTNTKEDSYRDLFWNGVYSVKSYIPRIQKGTNWKNGKFTGFKKVNYYGDKNPIPYNNIRVRIPFMYTILCVLIKSIIRLTGFLNWVFKLCASIFVKEKDEEGNKTSGSFLSLTGELCNTNLENLCIIPGVDIKKIASRDKNNPSTLLGMAIIKHYEEIGGAGLELDFIKEDTMIPKDIESIDNKNKIDASISGEGQTVSNNDSAKNDSDKKYYIYIRGIRVTDQIDYLIQCIEMNLAQEYKVVQFDFYNDWINGLIYIPRWMRNITKKHTFIFPNWYWGGQVKACNENYKAKRRNIVQQCALKYDITTNKVLNDVGCTDKGKKLLCHKNKSVRQKQEILTNGGIVRTIETMKSQYVYYFKPIDNSTSKNIRLFATDIILLGTLNNCDKWGIPNNLSEMVSSTYQMPPNLALTDSDLEGNDYETDWDTSKQISMYVKEKKGKITEIDLGSCYVGINPMEENGNYTEVAGIDWGYTGPLQLTGNNVATTDFFKPGGHFLGLTCRNSETNIKTCVNLSRICEYGVWMSQRQELNIPNPNAQTKNNSILEYATIPSGLIAKDEISDTPFRRIFASMNANKLKTVINNETGYPIYDFKYIYPTSFGGELNKYINSTTDKNNYNHLASRDITEHYHYFDDDDYYHALQDGSMNVPEYQIMRTSESTDYEYLKFRFGLNNNSFSERKKRYIISGSNYGIFPMYNNSFYFYFGLRDGKTALDEFKKQYYAVCEKNNNLVQIDRTIQLKQLSIIPDGLCDNEGHGSVSFLVTAIDAMFGEDGITAVLSGNNATYTKTVQQNQKIYFNSLKAGLYTLTLISNDGEEKQSYSIEVKRISITSELNAMNFLKDVSALTPEDKFKQSDTLANGGYLSFSDNKVVYEQGINTISNEGDSNDGEFIDINVFNSSAVKQIIIKGITSNVVIQNTNNSPYVFTCSGVNGDVDISQKVNSNGEYMIPVPFENETYEVRVIFNTLNCKPYGGMPAGGQHPVIIGNVTINNAIPLNITYNGLSYALYLKNYMSTTIDSTNPNGWWTATGASCWLYESLPIQWSIKEALYMNSLQTPHTVKIGNSGGMAPYTETITGMKDDASTTEGITRADFETVNVPTINYIKNDNRRDNFSYQVSDVNGQIYPEKPFIFPVIYKPFFMEIGVWYFDKNKKYYLLGSVYNGKTWDYETEGFNEVKLNNVPIANFATITDNDTTMSLDEVDTEGNLITGGGYDYMGPYFKYNGRKTSISREIEPITYGLHHNGIINNFNLIVGSKHEEDGIIYADTTNASRGSMEFFTFTITGTPIEDKYCVSMNVKVNDNSGKYKTIALFDDEINGYKYPLSGDLPNISPELHRALINDDIKASDLGNLVIRDGYIDVNAVSNGVKSLYYIALPDNSVELTKTSNSENKIKAISVSNLIDLNNLSKFYPLEIVATASDVLQSDGTYKTAMTIKPRITSREANINERITENFKNKKFVFTFYNGSIDMVTQTITIVTSNETTETVDITGYRSILGLKDKSTNLLFYFDAYLGEQKSPTSYLNVGGKSYNMAVTFTDNTPKEETPEEETPPAQ